MSCACGRPCPPAESYVTSQTLVGPTAKQPIAGFSVTRKGWYRCQAYTFASGATNEQNLQLVVGTRVIGTLPTHTRNHRGVDLLIRVENEGEEVNISAIAGDAGISYSVNDFSLTLERELEPSNG